MDKSHAQLRTFPEHAVEYHGSDRPGRFRAHPHEPRPPVLPHIGFTHHLPGMYEEGTAQFLSGLPKGLKDRIAEVFAIDVGAYLKPRHLQLFHTALHFFMARSISCIGTVPMPRKRFGSCTTH